MTPNQEHALDREPPFIDRARLLYSMLCAFPFALGLTFTRGMPASWRFLANAVAVAVFVVIGVRDALATGSIRIGTRRFGWRPLPIAWPLVAYLCWTVPPLIHHLVDPEGDPRWMSAAGLLVTLTVGLVFFSPINRTANPQR